MSSEIEQIRKNIKEEVNEFFMAFMECFIALVTPIEESRDKLKEELFKELKKE